MQCDYFDSGACRSCSLMGTPYAEQLAAKQARVAAALPGVDAARWREPAVSRKSHFRNKAKLVVGGTVTEPTLGILDSEWRGVDLRECGLYTPGIHAAIPRLARLVTEAGLTPYDVAARTGEAKYLIVTESPSGELMLRVVLRSPARLDDVRAALPHLAADLPSLAVASVNLHPEPSATLEGATEIVLTPRTTLPMRLGDLTLHLTPRSFFQTNTDVARALYAQARAWAERVNPASVWDLYCGVGGFALHLARRGGEGAPLVVGVESSPDGVDGARLSAADAHLAADFHAGDATTYATTATASPDLVVVNPPRRGLGADLATWLDGCDARAVIYSSCNVASLARDLAAMPSWRVAEARLFDMFPQTAHHEVAVLLTRG